VGMKGGRESDLVKAVLELLALRSVCAWRANAGVVKLGRRLIRLGPAGMPDVLAVLRPGGRLLGIECKAPRGRLRPSQVAFRDNLLAAGGLYLVIRSLDELADALDALG
jgi:hypothetical protein